MTGWLIRASPWAVVATAVLGLFGGSGLLIYRNVIDQPARFLPLILIAVGFAAMCYGLARGFDGMLNGN